MSDFKPREIKAFPESDTEIKVEDLLGLIEGSPFRDQIYESLAIEGILKETIKMRGINTLVKAVDAESKRFVKFDVKSSYEDVGFEYIYDEKDALKITFLQDYTITYPHHIDPETQIEIESSVIKASPIYSAKSALFGSLFHMEKYAAGLIDKELDGIVLANLKLLREMYEEAEAKRQAGDEVSVSEHIKRYRMLLDVKDNTYYFRALISQSRYQDYNIGVSVFATIMLLYYSMQEHGNSFSVKDIYYTESKIRVLFEDSQGKEISKIGKVKFLVELTNDETTQGPVRLDGMCYLILNKKKDGKNREVHIKNQYSEAILRIPHNAGPENAIHEMTSKDTLTASRKELYDSLDAINESRAHVTLLKNFSQKVNRSHTFNDRTKSKIFALLDHEVNNFSELLVLMSDAEAIVGEEQLVSKDYLSTMLFSLLIGKKGKKPDSEEDSEEGS